FDMDKEADAVEMSVAKVLSSGYRTGDIFTEGAKLMSCSEMGDVIAEGI
ncbi:MAG: 3-isopropylmalate dehydrogenase, partial [Oscillospiraceae bacterium]|nr:3-isopropylmalate dehydrogenase [Oscillospiraceae bacterium]